MRTRRTVPLLLLALALGVVACGDDDGDATVPTTEATPTSDDGGTTTTTTAEGTSTTTSDEGSTTTTTTTDGGASTPTGPVPDGELPGEPIDIFPYEGANLAVVGVEAGATLNVRGGPGTSFAVAVELDPQAVGFTATGRNRTLDDGSFWSEVTVDGQVGWANGAYLAQPGASRDITGDVSVPTDVTDTEAAALAVARQRAPEGEGPTPTVTVVARRTPTDVTVDVIGLADDAQKGERLHVTGSGADLTVEATALCSRGVTADGLCT